MGLSGFDDKSDQFVCMCVCVCQAFDICGFLCYLQKSWDSFIL